MGEYFSENNIVYMGLVVVILYLVYLYVFGGGVKAGLKRHYTAISNKLFSSSRK